MDILSSILDPFGVVCVYACPTTDWNPSGTQPLISSLDPIIQIQNEKVFCNWSPCEKWLTNPCSYCQLNRLFNRYYEFRLESQLQSSKANEVQEKT